MLEAANIWHYDHEQLENRQRHSERPFATAVTIEFPSPIPTATTTLHSILDGGECVSRDI